jgi:hypothetical protein
VEYAEIAGKKVAAVANAVAEAADAIKKYAVDKLFYLKSLCIEANLALASKGLCFILNADFYIGGKDGKHVVLENKEICLNRKFAMKIGGCRDCCCSILRIRWHQRICETGVRILRQVTEQS